MSGKTIVIKFGGTSVGTSSAMAQAIEVVKHVRASWERTIVVTSALSGVTNMLLDSAHHAAAGDARTYSNALQFLRQSHGAIADILIEDEGRRAAVKEEIESLILHFANLCKAIEVLGEATPRALDAVSSLGERMSVRLLAAGLNEVGLDAQFIEASEIIITDDHFQSAHPDMQMTIEQTRKILNPILDAGVTPVITGFMAATHDGVITTLGRGGSDYSAAIVGVALPADEVCIYTDVDGVMTADPRLVSDARTISRLTYREIAELAYYGAKVLHPKTIRPVIEAGIGLKVANTFNPESPGTRIFANGQKQDDGQIKSVSAITGQSLITIEGRGMLGVPGVAARAFSAVAATGTSVPLITQASSEQSICFAVPINTVGQVITALENSFANELNKRDIDRIWATEEVVIITVVGSGMQHTPGVAGKIFSSLGENGVNVIAIAQGSSEVSISLVVDARETRRAVQVLHPLILTEQAQSQTTS
jgi:aspartokinase/homoserine dehydrogenase 1